MASVYYTVGNNLANPFLWTNLDGRIFRFVLLVLEYLLTLYVSCYVRNRWHVFNVTCYKIYIEF